MKNYEKHILNMKVEDRLWRCTMPNGTIEHILNGCPALANAAYFAGHNQVAKIIHYELAFQANLVEDPLPIYNK